MFNKMFAVCLLSVLMFSLFPAVGSLGSTFNPSVIGGVRDGIALGMMGESEISKNASFRFGAEANSSNKPIILFLGGKFFLTNIIDNYPMSFGLGLVGYLGNKFEAGPSVSLIFDRIFDIRQLSAEFGIDIAGSGKLQLQAEYKI